MAVTINEQVGKALELLKDGLISFMVQEFKATYGKDWKSQAVTNLPYEQRDDREPMSDVNTLLLLMWYNWREVFDQKLGHSGRNLVSELREVRHKWAHQERLNSDDGYRALDSIERLLKAISAPQADEVNDFKHVLLRERYNQQVRNQRKKAVSLKGEPLSGLAPWREIVTPHPDVASGRFQQAEFAADLDAVYQNKANVTSEYSDPKQFFERTFLTEGLQHLLRTALLRVTKRGGDPVVELQTNFGGGKTHSMLALYHLFSGLEATSLAGIPPLLAEVNLEKLPTGIRRVVLVGSALSPSIPENHPDGITTYTLWGELAWQLGGPEGYAMVAQADQQSTSPGSNALYDLFIRFGPAIILIDEWVAYIRLTYKVDGLSGGSFDSNLTFAQSLSEAVKQAPGMMVVGSLPLSKHEAGSEGGQEALVRLKSTFTRLESSWRPATTEEGFEIVRRRLFQPVTDPKLFAARDAVIDAFSRLYQEEPSDFPSECREADYRRRMQVAYPIHPELFERLYSDWSSLEKFQRTRGVLRLMATVIRGLWERDDRSLMIMPASVPLDDSLMQSELMNYMTDNWVPIIERDVDGENSLPLALDRENNNLGRLSACRRVAHTIFIGSAPTARTNNPGLDELHIKLGCVQPGEQLAIFGDALRRLAEGATHLYVDKQRHWFSTQPSVTRLARDRAAQQEDYLVWDELQSRLQRAARERGDLAAVHATPTSSADVPDEQTARLVILGPKYPHTRRHDDSLAKKQISEMLAYRGTTPRLYQNMLVFLAPDVIRLGELADGIRQYLAWKSICEDNEAEILNLDNFQRNQAHTQRDKSNQMVDNRIKETYNWLIVPYQEKPGYKESLVFNETQLQIKEPLAIEVSKKLVNEHGLLKNYSLASLQIELQKYKLWPETDPHLSLKKLWEYLTRYPYLPRLKNVEVLLEAVRQSVGQLTWEHYFAYADSWDEAQQKYLGLQAGTLPTVSLAGLLVRAAVAQQQREAEAQAKAAREAALRGEPAPPRPALSVTKPGEVARPTTQPVDLYPVAQPRPAPTPPRRFFGTVNLNDLRTASEMKQISEAVVQHLSSLVGANVSLTLEIQADLPEGAPEHVVRTVTENARTLKFSQFEFSDE